MGGQRPPMQQGRVSVKIRALPARMMSLAVAGATAAMLTAVPALAADISGGGIKQIQNKTVTFGASDAPLKGAQLDKDGLVQFPMVMGGIVPVFNLEGIKAGDLVIDGPTLAKIFLGEIKSWDDAALKKLNPSVKLPSQAIAVVHRSDGSGTTFNFAYYLAEVS